MQEENDQINPFADTGKMVQGSRFIDRPQEAAAIYGRVNPRGTVGNVALVGEHRVGKSSLAWDVFVTHQKRFLEGHVVPVWVDLSHYQSALEFFRGLVNRAVWEFQKAAPSDAYALIYGLAQQVEAAMGKPQELQCIRDLFDQVGAKGWRIIFILDEFDLSRDLFREDTWGFQELRSLASSAGYKVTLVTISRRSISEIELQCRSMSTFDGVILEYPIGFFDDRAMQKWYARCEAVGLSLDDRLRKGIEAVCGSHPYLLDMLGQELIRLHFEEQRVLLDTAVKNTESARTGYYRKVVNLHRSCGSLPKLLRILFGPLYDVQTNDANQFLSHGLVRPNLIGCYEAFSDDFARFLALANREENVSPVWQQAEESLRLVIAETMNLTAGQPWASTPVSRYAFPLTFPQGATMTGMLSFIVREWSTFSPIVGHTFRYWQKCAEFLSNLDGPMSVDWRGCQPYERDLAESFCQDIISELSPRRFIG